MALANDTGFLPLVLLLHGVRRVESALLANDHSFRVCLLIKRFVCCTKSESSNFSVQLYHRQSTHTFFEVSNHILNCSFEDSEASFAFLSILVKPMHDALFTCRTSPCYKRTS